MSSVPMSHEGKHKQLATEVRLETLTQASSITKHQHVGRGKRCVVTGGNEGKHVGVLG